MAAPGGTTEPNRVALRIFARLGPRYDLLAELLSFGQNRVWRREAVERVATAAPALVLDVATGTAGVAIQMAARSGAVVVGVDLTEGMLRRGAANVARAGLSGRVQLVAARAEQLPFPDACCDGLTFSYLLRYVLDPSSTLQELARVVRPGAPVAGLEFHVPPGRFLRFWWWVYTRAVLPVAGLLAGGPAWYRVGRFLGPSITEHYRRDPLDSTVGRMRSAGLEGVGTRVMSLGGGVVMWGRRGAGG